MATKREVLEAAARGEGCLGKAADDEEIFVLRAHDPDAAGTVRDWIQRRLRRINRGLKPETDIDQCRDASKIAERMDAHQVELELDKKGL